MVDKRDKARARKRLMVRYGAEKLDRSAFTRNISSTGLFLQTNAVLKPGTTMQVEMKFPERTFNMWARVIWAKRVPPELARVMGCGMGIRFVDPDPEWREFFFGWAGIKASKP